MKTKDSVKMYLNERLRAQADADATYRGRRSTLNRFAEVCPEQTKDIRTEHIQLYIDTLNASGSKHTALKRIRAWIKWAMRRGQIRKDPTFDVIVPKADPSMFTSRALSDGEVLALWACAVDPRSRLILSLMVQEGLRIGEVSRIELWDVDRSRGMLGVRGKGYKGEISRRIPLSEDTVLAMKVYLEEERGDDAGPLVQSRSTRSAVGAHMTTASIWRIMDDLFRCAGVKLEKLDRKSPHALRHTCFTRLAEGEPGEDGCPTEIIQALAGHRSISTTQIYTQGVVPELRSWVGRTRYNVA